MQETLMGTGDEGLDWLSLGALSFLQEVSLLVFVFLLVFLGLGLGAMLEGDDVHLTKKTKGKGGREKKCEA